MNTLSPSTEAPAGKSARRWKRGLWIGAVGVAVLSAAGAWWYGNSWRFRLYTPTYIGKQGDFYFIVDCWHHRVLYSPTLEPEIWKWWVLDDDLAGPHSIASDGTFYVVDDTGRHGLRVYRRNGERLRLSQRFGGLGNRPHRVRYDAATNAFYVLAAESQMMTKLVPQGDRLVIAYKQRLDFLKGEYTRSFTIDGEFMYFVSGPQAITKTRYRDDKFTVVETYDIPEKFHGMNDVFRADDGWLYVTASYPKQMVRVRSLEELSEGAYDDLYRQLPLNGTPYYLSEIDGRLFVPQITQSSGVVSFTSQDGNLGDIREFCAFGPPTAADRRRFEALPR